MYQQYFIEIDGGNNVIASSKDNHSKDKNWRSVSVDQLHLDDFKKNCTNFQYDPSRGQLIPPDAITTSDEIPNVATNGSTSTSSDVNNKLTNLQNKVNSIHLKGLKIKDIEN